MQQQRPYIDAEERAVEDRGELRRGHEGLPNCRHFVSGRHRRTGSRTGAVPHDSATLFSHPGFVQVFTGNVTDATVHCTRRLRAYFQGTVPDTHREMSACAIASGGGTRSSPAAQDWPAAFLTERSSIVRASSRLNQRASCSSATP